MITINNKQYDFIDFGASRGGSIEFAKRVLGGKRGLGVDISENKIAYMKSLGYECINADITSLVDIPDNSVSFVILSHVLEHLDSLQTIQATINEAYRIASDYIYIQGPYFDADEYLEGLGLRFYWSHWRGHTYHFKITELEDILASISTDKKEILVREKVVDSSHPAIHPLTSPIDQHDYVREKHPPKEMIPFDYPVYREFVAFVAKRKLPFWDLLIHSKKDCVRYETLEAIKEKQTLGAIRRLVNTLLWLMKPQSLKYLRNK